MSNTFPDVCWLSGLTPLWNMLSLKKKIPLRTDRQLQQVWRIQAIWKDQLFSYTSGMNRWNLKQKTQFYLY